MRRPDSIPMLQVRIVKEDGAIGLFRGAGPTVVRAMALNMGMLASNDEVCSQSPNTGERHCLAVSRHGWCLIGCAEYLTLAL